MKTFSFWPALFYGRAGVALLCLAFVLELSGQRIPSNSPRSDLWFPDGPVNAILETNGVVYIGGAFESLSPGADRTCLLDAGTGLAVREFPKVNGFVYCAASDGEGGWYLGGKFTAVGGLPRTNLVRVLASHEVDSVWTPSADQPVHAIVRSNDEVFLGGGFVTISGIDRSGLASVDRMSGALRPWNPQACCASDGQASRVLAMAWDGARVFVGGVFAVAGGRVRSNIAALDSVSGEALPWPENQSGAGHFVSALHLAHDRLYIGGRFDSMGGAARANLAAVDPISGAAVSWSPNPNASVLTLASVGDCLYAGGTFTTLADQPRLHIGAVNAVSGQATSWNPIPDGPVHQIVISGHNIFVGGQFAKIGELPRPGLALLDSNSNRPASWTPVMSGRWAQSVTLHGSRLLVGNRLAEGETPRRSLAAFDPRSGRILDWNPDVDGPVFALAFANNVVYAGGDFLNAQGVPCCRLAALDSLTGEARSFAASVHGPNGRVETLAVAGGRLFAGGGFSAVGQSFAPGLAAFDATSGESLAWRPIANQAVHSITVVGETLYAAGSFTSVAGQPRNCFAAMNTANAALGAWNPNAVAPLPMGSALRAWQDLLFVGGNFSSIGGESRLHLAAIDRQTGLATSWNPALGSVLDSVRCLAVSGNHLCVAGDFSEVGGLPRTNVALINAASGEVLDWNPVPRNSSMAAPVAAVECGLGGVYIGGSFTSIRGGPHPHFAVFAPVGSPEILKQPVDIAVSAGQTFSLAIEAAGESPLSIQWQRNGFDVPGANTMELTVTNARAADSGTYVAVVTNSLGLVCSAAARVSVDVPLVITMQPVSRTVSTGSSVTFAVAASGYPVPQCQWYLNGQPIPGAAEPTLTFSKVQLRDGGRYMAAVFNGAGVVESDPAELVVTGDAFPLADNFNDRTNVSSISGSVLASNSGATSEVVLGEPLHAGKPGGRSVWLSWIAPATGIATFHTRGSDFDTLLAAYSFSVFGGLDVMDADDDRGGFLSSEVSFNAIAGKAYEIAVDGYFGESGRVVLSWNLENTSDHLPVLQLHPVPRTVRQGESVTFNVVASFGLPLSYQWLFNGFPVSGATNSFLFVPDVQPSNVGHYSARVTGGGRSVTSRQASLEMGSVPAAVSEDKLEETSLPGEAGENLVTVGLGASGSQMFSTHGSTAQFGEPIHANVPGGASRWMRFRFSTNATLLLDTIGSAFDTTLAIYSGTNVSSLSLVASDDNGAPDAARSMVRGSVEQGTDYFVAVDGVNGEQGLVRLNWKLGLAPVVADQTIERTLNPGASLTLSVTVSNVSPPLSFRWQRDSNPIAGATNSLLVLTNIQLNQAGSYSVVVSNAFGVVTHIAALIHVVAPTELGWQRVVGQDGVFFRVLSDFGQGSVIEATTNLVDWVPLRTNTSAGPLSFSDPDSTNLPLRFYRLVPWP